MKVPRVLSTGPITAVVAFLLTSGGCGRDRAGSAANDTGGKSPAVATESDWFTEFGKEAGLDFVHFNGMSGADHYPEIMPPGVALLDYDNDGDLDVFIVQGQMLGEKPLSQATFPPTGPLKDRLFRNDLIVHEDGSRTIHFTDVTESAGLDVRSYGMGVATGDFNNDGCVDIYRMGLGRSQLFRNNCDGTFTDVTKQAGVENAGRWAVSAAFVDFDRDGWLDLYVGNYLNYSLEADVHCLSVTGMRDYCPPNSYRPQPDRLYRNRGNGTFEDVTQKALIGGAFGPALGVLTADFNGDGWIDIFVANDGQPDLLWLNQRNGTFKEVGQLAGVAVNGAGQATSSMGVDAGDFENNGREALFITNWLSQTNTLFVNDGKGNFEDGTARSGLGPPSFAHTAFGTCWLDFDNDSWLDLFVANGAVATVEAQARERQPFPLREKNQLFRNLANGRFEDVGSRAGTVFDRLAVGRGVACGDIDNDGDPDVLLGDNSGPIRLLRNNLANGHHWLGLRLVGGPKVKRRDMLGARAEIVRSGQPTLLRRARADGSYASANDPRILAGLGTSTVKPRVRVTWPDGRQEEWADVTIDRYTTLEQGTGTPSTQR